MAPEQSSYTRMAYVCALNADRRAYIRKDQQAVVRQNTYSTCLGRVYQDAPGDASYTRPAEKPKRWRRQEPKRDPEDRWVSPDPDDTYDRDRRGRYTW